MSTLWLAVVTGVLSGLLVLLVRAGIFCLRIGDTEGKIAAIFAAFFALIAAGCTIPAWITLVQRHSTLALVFTGIPVAIVTIIILVVFKRLTDKELDYQDSISIHW